jgi:hypothetical protein
VFRWLGWGSHHCLGRVAGATAAAVIVLVSTNGAVAAMDEGVGRSSSKDLEDLTDALNSGSVERIQALLADEAIIVDHDGSYAGAPGRLAVKPAPATAATVAVVVPVACLLVALGLFVRRVRRRGRTLRPPGNLLQHLHEATIQRRQAVGSAGGRGSDLGSAALHLRPAKSTRP